jgi:8-oxo-dGTP diphosphatase
MSVRSLVGCPCSNPRMHEVVVGALVREGRVLLVHRSPNKRAYPNIWDLPGGHIEAGESELGALTRELQEELGVQIATGSASHLCRLTAGPAEEPALLSAWLVRDWQGTPANVAPEEHDDIGWLGLEELPPLAHVLVRTILVNAIRSTAAELQRAAIGMSEGIAQTPVVDSSTAVGSDRQHATVMAPTLPHARDSGRRP